MDDDLGILHLVAIADVCGGQQAPRDGRLLKTLNSAAFVADKMCVGVAGFVVGVAEGISPDAVIALHAVEHLFGGEGVQRAIDGDGVCTVGETVEDFRGGQGAFDLSQEAHDTDAHGRPLEAGLLQKIVGVYLFQIHKFIVTEERPCVLIRQAFGGNRKKYRIADGFRCGGIVD